MSGVDLDLVEINEAFAAVALHSTRMLFNGDDSAQEKVNVNGGAVALRSPDRLHRRAAHGLAPARAEAQGWRSRGGDALRRWRSGRRAIIYRVPASA